MYSARDQHCPHAYACLFDKPDGTSRFKICPCNAGDCQHCRRRRRDDKLFKALQGFRNKRWQLTTIRIGSSSRLERRNLAARLRKRNLLHASVVILAKGSDGPFSLLCVYHEPLDDGQVLRWNIAFSQFRSLLQADNSRTVRFSRNFPPTSAEVRQRNDRRAPDQKWRLVGCSRYSVQRFQKLATECVGVKLESGMVVPQCAIDVLVTSKLLPPRCAVRLARDDGASAGRSSLESNTARSALLAWSIARENRLMAYQE